VGVSGQASAAGQGWGVGQVQGDADGDGGIAAIGWGSTGYPDNANDALVLPAIDLSQATDPVLEFATAYDIQNGNAGGKVIVWDGAQWTFPDVNPAYPVQQLLYQTPADGWFSGTQGSWQVESVDLGAYKGQSGVVVAFWFVSDDGSTKPAGWGGFWAVDAVVVAEASALSSSTSGSTGSSTGHHTHHHHGSTGGSTSSSSGHHTHHHHASTGGSTSATAGSVVFEENFEGSSYQVGRASAKSTTLWTVDNPSQYASLPISAAADGSFCAGTSFAAPYAADVEDVLYTAEIDLTGKTSATLEFAAAYGFPAVTAASEDGVRILATPDQGTTWYLVSPTPGYDTQAIGAFKDAQGQSTPGFGGTTGGWQSYSVDLTPAIGVAPKWIIAWEFGSKMGGGAGFFLDSIQVTAQ
jgi:hypothetical protein